jgi:hypothetical protein
LPALTVANDVLAEFQVAVELMSFCVPSLRVAIALSCKVCPIVTAEFCGDKMMDLTVAEDVEFELELLTSPQPMRHIANTSVTARAAFLNPILFTPRSPVHNSSWNPRRNALPISSQRCCTMSIPRCQPSTRAY